MERQEAVDFKASLKAAVVKVLEPHLSWTKKLKHESAHNMFALMLDPRFKRLKCVLDYVEDRPLATTICKEYSNILVLQLEAAHKVLNPGRVSSAASLASCDDGGLYDEEPQSVTRQMEDELKHFRKATGAALLDDPTLWWKDNATNYPHCAYVARHYLSIPGSQAEVERCFSVAGVFTRLHRINMGTETLDVLIRINKNVSNDPDVAMGKFVVLTYLI